MLDQEDSQIVFAAGFITIYGIAGVVWNIWANLYCSNRCTVMLVSFWYEYTIYLGQLTYVYVCMI